MVTLFPRMTGTCLTYKDISEVMDVSKGLVSRIKRYYEEHPEKVFRDPEDQASLVMFLDK